MQMQTTTLAVSLLLALAIPVGASARAPAHDHAAAATAAAAAPLSPTYVATQNALRDLWVEHVFWARNYVFAVAAGDAPRAKVAADEVVANATAISGAIVPFYGEAAGEQLLGLLAGHWGAVKAYADSSLGDDAAGAKAAGERLSSNARELAAFLAGANPYLPEDTLVGLLAAHGAHHVAQTREVGSADFAAEARTWAAMRQHMFVIADALTGALARQFPQKF